MGIALSPAEIEKCFFAIESEFQPFEQEFIANQLRKRTNLKLTSEFPVRPLGIEFIAWFLDKIQDDLGIFGNPLCEAILFKLKKFRTGRKAEYTKADWYYFNKCLKEQL